MKKQVKIAIGVTVGLGVFASGFFGKEIYTKASGDWATSAENQAYSDLLQTANKTQSEITNNIDSDVNAKISNAITGTVDQQQAELERLMKEYYQMKIDGLTESDSFKQLEQKIRDIQASVLASFKQKIDTEFANQTQTTTP